MPKIFKILILACVVIAGFVAVNFSLAAEPGDLDVWGEGSDFEVDEGTIQEGIGLGSSDPRTIAANIIRISLGFLGLIAVGMIMYSGWLWMTAGGNQEKIDKAKKILIGAIIGLVIILSSFAIVTFIINRMLEDVIGGGGDDPGGGGDDPGGGVGGTPSFYTRYTKPSNESIDNFRNSIVKLYFNTNVDYTVFNDENKLEDNFKVFKVGDATLNTEDEFGEIIFNKGFIPPVEVAVKEKIGTNNKDIEFIPATTEECKIGEIEYDCFDELVNIEVKLTQSAFKSVSGIALGNKVGALDCESEPGICKFIFSTNNLIDNGMPVIYDISPKGGFCDGSLNTPCQSDNDCSSFDPNICNDDTSNGAIGNFITITGRNFGTTAWTIDFCTNYIAEGGKCGAGDDEWIVAKLADDEFEGNPKCGSEAWKDTQIIAVVPSGVSGSSVIKVTTVDSYEDTTADDWGDKIDFIGNTIARPSLCKLENSGLGDTTCVDDSECLPAVECSSGNCIKNHGESGDTINYDGIKFTGGEVYFGNYKNYIEAINSVIGGDKIGVADVPIIAKGKTSSFVAKDVGGILVYGNALNFIKDKDIPKPYISYFDPTQGAPSQYVTIYGGGFGKFKGTSKVYFVYDTVEASYEFPEVCAESVWTDNQVIVKVPDGLSGDYTITMEIAGWETTIDTSELTPSQIFVNSTLTLKPSLCKISPKTGLNNSDISLWGENFGNQATGLVKFHLNKDQSSGIWGTEEGADKIDTTIPLLAISGPVKVVQDGEGGNSIDIMVGSCKVDDDCGVDYVCCPIDSPEANKCKAGDDQSVCYTTVTSSVYEWDFSTGGGTCPIGQEECGDTCCSEIAGGCEEPLTSTCATCEPGQFLCDDTSCCNVACVGDPGSTYCPGEEMTCSGYSYGQCSASELCPNSPGQCSFYEGGSTIIVGSCSDSVCDDLVACTPGACTYNSSLNKCSNGVNCSLSKTVQDSLGKDVNAYCAEYGDPSEGRWHIDTAVSCPDNWSSIGQDKCIEDSTTCNYCDSGFACSDQVGSGVCAVDQDICLDSTCNVGTGNCEAVDSSECECCCRIDKADQDCCADLDCTGTCGSDTTDDEAGFGQCTGCALAGDTKEEQNAACNCTGTSGKFCDTGAANGSGVCRDCAQLSTSESCSANSDVCCIDNESGDSCKGGDGTLVAGGGGYCAYYSCKGEPEYGCNEDTPDKTGAYKKVDACEAKCPGGPVVPPGEKCIEEVEPLTCSLDFDCGSTDYKCIDTPDDVCGSCCCDPTIPDVSSSGLTCVADKAPCDGASRGLYCGCTQDTDCGDSETIGCGSDTCCRARPNDKTILPAYDAPAVCRNAMISVKFDTEMDISSFTGNVIVAGEYTDGCPDGTVPMLQDFSLKKDKKLLAKTYSKIINLFKKLLEPIVGEKILAFVEPQIDKNYCAITGTVSGQGDTLKFAPSKLLEANTKYFVIIKGDEDLNDAISSGVLSSNGIGMNGDDDYTFNANAFTNAEVWSFTTLPKSADNAGICKIDTVKIEPDSYLFRTSVDVASDNNPGVNYDTIDTDSDKVFESSAWTNDGQELTSIPGDYEWTWDWEIDNTMVAKIKDKGGGGGDDDETDEDTRVVGQKKEDAKTYISATAIVEGSYEVGDEEYSGKADIYVMTCNNPWPPFEGETWEPWRDSETGEGSQCDQLPIPGGCLVTNYEFYYCRDKASQGTYDDLPAIKKDNIIIGITPSICMKGDNINDPCGADNDCWDVPGDVIEYLKVNSCRPEKIKEFYFFMEEIPGMPSSEYLTGNALPQGEAVQLNWYTLGKCDDGSSCGVGQPSACGSCLPDPDVIGYKVYYGASTEFAGYGSPVDVNGVITVQLGKGTAYPEIIDLANKQEYYFAVTAYYDDEVEGSQSNILKITPSDVTGPSAPVISEIIAGELAGGSGKIKLSWNEIDEAESYLVYISTKSDGPYNLKGETDDILYVADSLVNGVVYYFKVSALDKDENEGFFSNVVNSIPVVAPTGLTAVAGEKAEGSGNIKLSWTAAEGAEKGNYFQYKIYSKKGDEEYSFEKDEGILSTETTVTGLVNGEIYYFVIKTDNSSDESYPSIEVSNVPIEKPTGLVATAGDNQVALSWTAAAGADKYKVYYDDTDDGTYDNSKDAGSDTSEIIGSLVNSTTYYFVVKAVNSKGNESEASDKVSETPVEP
ncbi:MAG: fibronectin type III domain-containing protein [Patescibacteria group bacterium]